MAVTIASPFGQQLFANLAPWQTDDLARYCQAIGVIFDPVLTLVAEVGSDGDPGYIPTWGRLFDVTLCPLEDLGYLGNYVGVEIPVGTPDATARALIQAEAALQRGTPASLVSTTAAYLTGTAFTATTTLGSTTLSSVSSFTNLNRGGVTILTGAGIAPGATITSLNPGAGTLVMSAPATATATGVSVTAKNVFLQERYGGNAYQIRIAVYTSETHNYALAAASYPTYAAARVAYSSYSAAGAYGSAAVTTALARVKPAGLLLTFDVIVGGDYASARDTHATYQAARSTYATYTAAHADPTQQ